MHTISSKHLKKGKNIKSFKHLVHITIDLIKFYLKEKHN